MTREARIAWVTGATGYWGRKTVLSLLRKDWQVILLCRSRPEELLVWAEAHNKSCHWQPMDFEDLNWQANLVPLPTPQIFMHCSVVFDDNIARMFQINVIQPIQLVELVMARMQEQSLPGHIGIFLGQNGRLGLPGLGAFSATQGALWTWVESRARELKAKKSQISVSLVFPERAPSKLQSQLANRLNRTIKLSPPSTADKLVEGVLACQRCVGRKPLLAGLSTLTT